MITKRVMYIGRKAKKEDNIAGSGVVWLGHGDIQDVSDAAWAKLSPYFDVWVEVPAEPPSKPAEQPKPVGGLSDAPAPNPAVDLYSMRTSELRDYAVSKSYAVDLALKGSALREAIQAAGG